MTPDCAQQTGKPLITKTESEVSAAEEEEDEASEEASCVRLGCAFISHADEISGRLHCEAGDPAAHLNKSNSQRSLSDSSGNTVAPL